jgi:hypothetical protein
LLAVGRHLAEPTHGPGGEFDGLGVGGSRHGEGIILRVDDVRIRYRPVVAIRFKPAEYFDDIIRSHLLNLHLPFLDRRR